MKKGGTWRIWTPQDIATAARIFANLCEDHRPDHNAEAIRAIARAIKRDFSSVLNRLRNYGPTFTTEPRERYNAASPKALIDRDKRFAAADLRDLTGILCGDPPPGYSALDRMRR